MAGKIKGPQRKIGVLMKDDTLQLGSRKMTMMETMGHVTKPISPLLHTNGIH